MFFLIDLYYTLLPTVTSRPRRPRLGTSSTGVVNRMLSGGANRRLSCVAVTLGKAAVNAIASTAKRCFLGGLPRKGFILRTDSIKCGAVDHGIDLGGKGALRRGFRLRRSTMTLSKIMISTGHDIAGQHLTPALIGIMSVGVFRGAGSPALSRKLGFRPNIQIRAGYRGYNFRRIHVGKLSNPCARVLVSSHPVFDTLSNICKLRRVPTGVVRQMRIVQNKNSTLFNSSTVTKAVGVVAGRPLHGSKRLTRALASVNNDSSFSGGASLGTSLIASSRQTKLCIFKRGHRQSTCSRSKSNCSRVPGLGGRAINFHSFLGADACSGLAFRCRRLRRFHHNKGLLGHPPRRTSVTRRVRRSVGNNNLGFSCFTPGRGRHLAICASTRRASHSDCCNDGGSRGTCKGAASLAFVNNSRCICDFNGYLFVPTSLATKLRCGQSGLGSSV